jgi:hypothetical protein
MGTFEYQLLQRRNKIWTEYVACSGKKRKATAVVDNIKIFMVSSADLAHRVVW